MPRSFVSLPKYEIFIFLIRRYLLLKKVLLLCFLILWAITACFPVPPATPTPTPSSTLIAALSIVTGGPCEVALGASTPLNVTGMPGTDVVYSWTASAGNVNPPDKAAVVYTAPNTPGDVIITVVAQRGEVALAAYITCKITGPTPTPVNTLTFTATWTRTPTGTSTLLPPSCDAPAAPVLKLHHFAQTADLVWTLGSDVTRYEVYRSLDDGEYDLQEVTTETTLTISVSPSFEYRYFVVAVNDCGENNRSNIVIVAATVTSTSTVTPTKPSTPDVTQTLQGAFHEIDSQFQDALKSNIAYNAPKEMKLDETVTIELLLNPFQSKEELTTQLVEQSGLPTSTAEPGQLVTDQGGEVSIATDEVSITDHMKAVLRSRKLGAFEIQELHDNSEQIISGVETTKWRWSVTAKEQGERTLDLALYRLVKYGDEEHWREVESYRADITVKVTTSQRIKSLDWKWIVGIALTALLIPLFFRWYDSRKKGDDGQKHPRPPKRRYHS